MNLSLFKSIARETVMWNLLFFSSFAFGNTRAQCRRVLSLEPYRTLLSHDILTDEEVIELVKIVKLSSKRSNLEDAVAKRSREEALEKIVLGHQKLIAQIALKMTPTEHVSIEDLMQAGSIGLYKAIEKFDPSGEGRVFPFFFTARQWIRDEMREALTYAHSGIRYSRYHSQMIRATHKAQEAATESLAGALIEAIAKAAKMKKGNISQAQSSVFGSHSQSWRGQIVSLDEIVSRQAGATGRNLTLSDFLLARPTDPLENKIFVSEILERLQKREAEILHMRFVENKTLKEVASHFGISYERIRQIEDRALKAIRAWLQANDEY